MTREPETLQSALAPDRFGAHARQRLLAAPSDLLFDPRSARAIGRSDWDLDPQLAGDLAVMESPTPAAVLVPIVMRPTLSVLLTQRTETLAKHAGQISFPGGRVDPEDAGPIDTACREAMEEIGLDRRHVEHIGYLDGYRTGTGYHITPVVALVHPPFTLKLQPQEVAQTFEVPLEFLLNPLNHQQHTREWRGRMRSYWAMPYGDHYIWGATAGMLKNLAARLCE
jgi:8-oxo-dGTP pyrophosphatase MutT (NUDIX family)